MSGECEGRERRAERSASQRFEGGRPNVARVLFPSIGRGDKYCEGQGAEASPIRVRPKVGKPAVGEKVSLRVSRPQLVEECGFATEELAMFLSCFGEEASLIVTCDGRN